MLLYDFTAQVGDTVHHSGKAAFRSIILEIDSIQIGGEYRKRYKVDNGWFYHNPDYIVEGIGSIQNGLLGHISDIPLCGTHYWEHVCFSEGGIVKYKNPAYSDCYADTLKSYRSVFGKDTTQWNYLTDYNVADLISTAIYKAHGDTVINNYKYLNLFESYMRDTVLLGMVREDTIIGQVWIRYIDDSTDYLIMDLSLEVNDTFLLQHRTYPAWDARLVVRDVIYNQYGKNVVLEGYNRSVHFIEGIGPDFIFRSNEGDIYSELLCVYKDNEQTYYNPIEDTCFFEIGTGISAQNTSVERIYPNPTSGMVTIEVGSKSPCMVTISGLNGQLLYFREINDPTFQIDLMPFRKGIYIVSVRSQEYVLTGKIVKL